MILGVNAQTPHCGSKIFMKYFISVQNSHHKKSKDAEKLLYNSRNPGIKSVQLGKYLKKSLDEIGKLNDKLQRMKGCLHVHKNKIQNIEVV